MAVPKSKKGLNKRVIKVNYKKFNLKSKNFNNSSFINDLKLVKNIDRVFLI